MFARVSENAEIVKKHFRETYYSHDPSNESRKIYFCFADTGMEVINRLLEDRQQDKIRDSSIRGIIVVMIPDSDWISNYEVSDDLHQYIANRRKKIASSRLKERTFDSSVIKMDRG